MEKPIELYCLEVIRGKKKGIIPFFVRILLRILSWFYSFGIFWRNWVFDKGWLRCYSPPVPVVISVGNIVSGGTGKTPVTMMLAKQLVGFPLAILSRGYRSPAEYLTTPLVLNRAGEGPLYPASYCGDEPYLMALNVPEAWIFVGRNREKASTMAAKAGVRVIMLDDGMQYRRLARDFEVVVIDAADPFGQGYLLPRGLLREHVRELARADLLIINHIKDRAQYLTIKHKLTRFCSAPIVATHSEISTSYDLNGQEIGSLKGKRVGLFCGIGNPEHFKQMVLAQDAIIVGECILPDHRAPDREELVTFAKNCQSLGAEFLVCTEKDKVKLAEEQSISLPIAWFKMQLHVVEGQAHWDAFLEQIKEKLKKDAIPFDL